MNNLDQLLGHLEDLEFHILEAVWSLEHGIHDIKIEMEEHRRLLNSITNQEFD